MEKYRSFPPILKQDAPGVLLSSGDPAVVYFTRRDLLGEATPPFSGICELPPVRKLLAGQREDGSWRHPGAKPEVFPPHHYLLVETFKRLRLLVQRFGLNIEHPIVARAAEFILSCQSAPGDIRGFIGNQYATYYTGAVLSILIDASLRDHRIEKGLRWLLSVRQDDGGWSIPILTKKFDGKTMNWLTSEYAEPVEPDRSQPFSHNWTNMVLPAFAAHPDYRTLPEVRAAGTLLKSCFFQPDTYTSYREPRYWVRFVHWWPNLLTALESLARLGFTRDDADIKKGLDWFVENQRDDGLWDLENDGKQRSARGKTRGEREWLGLRICRMLRAYFSDISL